MLKTMNPQTVRELISQETDILGPAIKEEEDLYSKLHCPMCYGDGCTKKIRAPRIIQSPDGPVIVASPFGKGPLASGYAHCIHCGTDFDPRTGIILGTEASMLHGLSEDPDPT